MNPLDAGYRNKLAHFRVRDLKLLLEAFGRSIKGRKTELRKRALKLLSSRPVGNYEAYLSKIFDIYHSMNTHQRQKMSMGQIQTTQQRTYQSPQYPQKSVHMTPARLPQFVFKMEELIYGHRRGANSFPRNTMANNPIQYVSGSYQPIRHRNVVPSTSGNSNASAFIPSPQIIANYKFKKLPFFDVIKDIKKPTFIDDSNRCTLSTFPEGTSEFEFNYTMSNEEIELIAMNQDTSNCNCDYPFNCQIRICQLDQIVSTEVTDELPNGLHIRINGTACPLPPFLSTARPGIDTRRIAGPINCAQILQLNPLVSNVITINWIPGGKKYALAMYIVKQLSVDILVKKLQVNKVRSSEETKNDIIKKLTFFDSDLATASYNFSLVCPLSTFRMKIPAKSSHCDHLQCFDAHTFILMNEKRPKWMCPTCLKSCMYDEIRIDGYFLEIVKILARADHIKEIGLLNDGSWIIPEKNIDIKNTNSTTDNTVIELDD